jgi:hypothetical protein
LLNLVPHYLIFHSNPWTCKLLGGKYS